MDDDRSGPAVDVFKGDGTLVGFCDKTAKVAANARGGLAARLVARMATLRNKAEQAAYVVEVKARFGRKRNFMKLLG